MAGRVRITDRDQGFARLMRALSSRAPQVEVGIPPESPAAEAAYFGEFGSRTQPPRPLLRGWFDTTGRALGQRLHRGAAEAMLRGQPPSAAVAEVGAALEESARAHVLAGVPPALDPDTDDPDRPPFAGTSIPEAITHRIVK
jgi:hypothetical protein